MEELCTALQAEKEADVVIWDGGNNDTPFLKASFPPIAWPSDPQPMLPFQAGVGCMLPQHGTDGCMLLRAVLKRRRTHTRLS
jgi:hypothetical protein